jgi:hypothetical protein
MRIAVFSVILLVSSAAFAPGSSALVKPWKSALHYSDDKDKTSSLTTPTSSIPSALAFLDLNGDGKLDDEDIGVFCSNIKDLNKKNALSAFSAVLLAWLLATQPAFAKGGGGGGGGGEGSRHGGSSDDFPAYKRRFRGRNNIYFRPFDIQACSNLPGEGELVDMLVSRPGRTSYLPETVDEVDESRCEFVAHYSDGSRTIGKTHQNVQDWLLPGAAIGATISYFLASGIEDSLNVKKDEDLDAVFDKMDDTLTTSKPPIGGTFKGETTESDGSIQTVNAKLNFRENGLITGSGTDSFDGEYSIRGAWKGRTVRWTENYEHYSVTVRGEISETGSIHCRFRSSRGIRGRFKLTKS